MFEQKIYHGCHLVDKDGTRVLIDFKNSEKCLLPIANPFWKKAEDYHYHYFIKSL